MAHDSLFDAAFFGTTREPQYSFETGGPADPVIWVDLENGIGAGSIDDIGRWFRMVTGGNIGLPELAAAGFSFMPEVEAMVLGTPPRHLRLVS
jgi:hypothetical protein